MKFSGTLSGILRGKKHSFQIEWVDIDSGFEAVEGGYNITTIEGEKPYSVFITTETMNILIREKPDIQTLALRTLANERHKENLFRWLRCEPE